MGSQSEWRRASLSDRLILASASPVRARLLHCAGVDFAVQPAEIDEAAIKRRFRQDGCHPRDCAVALAAAKAEQVSARFRQAVVIGADQILICGAEWFDKPANAAEARHQLQVLRGRSHVLETAVCAIGDGTRLWAAASSPRLTMRKFSDSFLDRYIAQEGASILGSVGAYRLEQRGAQLFDKIDGDFFAILGLPVIELLDFLRDARQLER